MDASAYRPSTKVVINLCQFAYEPIALEDLQPEYVLKLTQHLHRAIGVIAT